MKIFQLLLVSIFATSVVFAQPSSPANKKTGVISNGRISTVFTNSGVLGQPGNKGPRFSWGHPNNGYIGDLSFIVSGTARMQKTTDFSSSLIKNLISVNKDSVFHFATICDVSRPAKGQEQDPSGNLWGFQPKAGFANPDQPSPAISDFPTTWPLGWTDFPWYNPAFKGNFIETQFILSDETDLEFNLSPFNYKPSGSNPDLAGLGLEVKTHFLLPKADDNQVGPLKNVMYLVHDVKNGSDYEIRNLAFSWIFGGYIGLTGYDDSPKEYNDDAIGFDDATGIYYSWDFPLDNKRNPNWAGNDVGFVGMKLIGSPDKNGWTYKSRFAPANDIDLKSDESLFTKVRINKVMPLQLVGDDGDGITSSGESSLRPGETARYITVVGFGNNKADLFQNLQNAKTGWDSGFTDNGDFVNAIINHPIFNLADQKIEITSRLKTDASYFLTVENIDGTVLLQQTVNPVFQLTATVDFSGFPAGDYILKLKPVSGEGPTDQTPILIQNAWTSYQNEAWKGNYNSFSLLVNPDIVKKLDNYQYKIQWNETRKGGVSGKINLDFLDEAGKLLRKDVPYSRLNNILISNGVEGYSLYVDHFLSCDTLDLSSLTVFPDSAIILSKLFYAKSGDLVATGDTLISFKIVKGTDTSIPWPLAAVKAVSTQFKVVDPVNGKLIPFILAENVKTKNGKADVHEELILLYELSEIVVNSADTLWGIDGTKYRFANRVEIEGKGGFAGSVDSANADFYRVPRSPVIIPVSGSTILSIKNETPASFQIGNPYPNPFNPSVSIQISVLNQSLPVEMKVFNVLGQLISSQSLLPSGNSVMTWNGKSQNGNSVPSGTYFLEFKQGTNHAVRKAVLIK